MLAINTNTEGNIPNTYISQDNIIGICTKLVNKHMLRLPRYFFVSKKKKSKQNNIQPIPSCRGLTLKPLKLSNDLNLLQYSRTTPVCYSEQSSALLHCSFQIKQEKKSTLPVYCTLEFLSVSSSHFRGKRTPKIQCHL